MSPVGPRALPLGVTLLRRGDARGPADARTGNAGGCPVPSSTARGPRSPGDTAREEGRAPCPGPNCPVPVGAPPQPGYPASPGCPCTPAARSLPLGPLAGSGVAAAEPGEGPCRRLPCSTGIHQLHGSGSIYNQEALACQRATLGCAGHLPRQGPVPMPVLPPRGWLDSGVPWPFLGCCCSTSGGPSAGKALGASRHVPGAPPWHPCAAGPPVALPAPGLGGKGCGAGRRGGAAIISAVTHVLITENGLISLRLEAA